MNHYQITSSDPSQDAININSCMRGDIGTKWSLVDQYLKHNRDQEGSIIKRCHFSHRWSPSWRMVRQGQTFFILNRQKCRDMVWLIVGEVQNISYEPANTSGVDKNNWYRWWWMLLMVVTIGCFAVMAGLVTAATMMTLYYTRWGLNKGTILTSENYSQCQNNKKNKLHRLYHTKWYWQAISMQ